MVLNEKKVQRVGYNLASRGLVGVLGTSLASLVGGCGDCGSNYQNPQSNLPTPIAQETPGNSLETNTQRYFNSTPEVKALKEYLIRPKHTIEKVITIRYIIKDNKQIAVIITNERDKWGRLNEVLHKLEKNNDNWVLLSGFTVVKGRKWLRDQILAETTEQPIK